MMDSDRVLGLELEIASSHGYNFGRCHDWEAHLDISEN